jgi:hypothetical protein
MSQKKLYGIFRGKTRNSKPIIVSKNLLTNRQEAIIKAQSIQSKHPEQYVAVLEIKRTRILKPAKK